MSSLGNLPVFVLRTPEATGGQFCMLPFTSPLPPLGGVCDDPLAAHGFITEPRSDCPGCSNSSLLQDNLQAGLQAVPHSYPLWPCNNSTSPTPCPGQDVISPNADCASLTPGTVVRSSSAPASPRT